MKNTFWTVSIIIALIVVNITLMMAFYNKISSNSNKNTTSIVDSTSGNANLAEKHPLDYLKLKNKLTDNFGEYVLNDYKSKYTMNVRVDEMLLTKQNDNIVLNGKLTNDSNIEVTWVLLNINFFNSAGHKIDFIPYSVLSSKDGDKPLKQGESIKLNHVFAGGFRMMKNSTEWDGRFEIEVLTNK